MFSSLIGHLGSRRFRLSTTSVSMSLAVRASLRNRHLRPSRMGFEDEAVQSNGRPCRNARDRSKRTHVLTSPIVPRGTSFHRSVGSSSPHCTAVMQQRFPATTETRCHRSRCVRYRLVGTKVTAITGFEFTGRYLDEVLGPAITEPWMDYYATAARTREPLLGSVTMLC